MSSDYGELTPEQKSAIGRLLRFCMTNKLVVAGYRLGVAPQTLARLYGRTDRT